jgi:TolA-binding protein
MNRGQARPVLTARLVLLALTFMALAMIPCETWAQSASTPPGATAQGPQSQSGASPQTPPGDDLAQMRADLNQMDSLLGNMSSEIEFLRDQNLQILLRTNARMWTILIRDLRKQVDREEQQRNRGRQPEGESPAPKPR